MKLFLSLLIGAALTWVGTNAATCETQFMALGTASTKSVLEQCGPFVALQTCTVSLKSGTPHRVAMENALVAFGASLKEACKASDTAPTIKTSNGKIVFDADDHTFMRRRRDTVSLFDMSDKVDATEVSLAALVKKSASDRTDDLAAQAKINKAAADTMTKAAGSAKTLEATVTKMNGALEGLVAAVNTEEAPCTPGVEFQSGKDKQGKAICKYLTFPCHELGGVGYFQKTAATRISDRVCAKYSPRPAGQYLAVRGGAYDDNVHKKFKVCTKDKEWESVAGTATSDRTCKAVTDCKKAGKVVYKPATATSDAVCATVGQTKDSPARDCVEIKQKFSSLKSDFYWVNGGGSGVRLVWCDQEHQGGGWMQVGYVNAANRVSCHNGNSDCQINFAGQRSNYRAKTWKMSNDFINHFKYYAIRFSGTNKLKGENYWAGKDVRGGCAYNHNKAASGACKKSYKTVSTKLGGAPSFGGGCQGRYHGCHAGVGDWPCYNGEVTTHHCDNSWTGWYFHAASKGGSQGSGQCNYGTAGCDAALYIR